MTMQEGEYMEWKTTWSYLPVNHNTSIATIKNTTVRGFFANNLKGDKVRIKFSNLYSKETLVFDQVAIGKVKRNSKVIEEIKTLFYKGEKVVEIGPGQVFYSDEIDFAIDSSEDIVLSIYIKNETNIYSVCSTWSAKSWNTSYGLDGNYTMDQKFLKTSNYDIYKVLQYDENRANHIYGISKIEVMTTSQTKTITLFGDSITHMSYYSDALTNIILDKYPGRVTVLNRGLGGNRLLHDYTPAPDIPGGGTIFGGPGIERFERDVYQRDTPDYVVVLIGINDFTHPYFFNHHNEIVSIDQYKKAINQLIDTAHSKGSKILIGTVLPFKKQMLEWFDIVETLRKDVNQWIREQTLSDGIVDFDLAVRDKDLPEEMDDSCHLGDGIHPNAEGGKRMAAAVPIEWMMEEG